MDTIQVSLICKALSDPNRLLIIQLLTYGEQCGCELLDQMQITQPTLSHHMKTLEDCGLVSSRKKGKWNYYSLNWDTIKNMNIVLQDMLKQHPEKKK